jgi:replicative DNA helicase
MADSPLLSGADAFDVWQKAVLDPTPPLTWSVGPVFDHVEIGPGRIVLVGGAPNAGKTALIMQWAFDALALNPALRVVVANVEMMPGRLLDRQLARLSGVPLTAIRRRQVVPDDAEKLGQAIMRISDVAPRLGFVRGPHTLDRIATAADLHTADLIVLDYLQRVDLPGKFNGLREKTNALMSVMRNLTDGGVGILAAAALTRSRDGKGRSSYDGKHLNLASFWESSELEYGADDVFLLCPIETSGEPGTHDHVQRTMLRHAKSRDSETTDVKLEFHRRVQEFRPPDPWAIPVGMSLPSPVAARAAAAWGGNGNQDGG